MNYFSRGRQFLNKITGLDQIKSFQVNTYCNTLLQELNINQYLPRSIFSLNSYCLAYILNDIVINNRKTIIEFGSGYSSIFIAKLAQLNKINLEIISVDEDQNWVQKLNENLINEGLTDYIKLIYAPLVVNEIDANKYVWYDTKILNNFCINKTFDMVIVDGPKVTSKEHLLIRGQSLYYLKNNLSAAYSIFLDDLYRKGEKRIIKNWQKDFNISFNIKNNIAIGYVGKFFVSDPI